MKDGVLTEHVIGCFFDVYNDLKFGFPEAVYAGALDILFRAEGISARREHRVEVLFRGQAVGSFRVDFLVEERLILELKVGHQLPMGSRAQLLNYLRTARTEIGLLLFFGPAPEIERVSL